MATPVPWGSIPYQNPNQSEKYALFIAFTFWWNESVQGCQRRRLRSCCILTSARFVLIHEPCFADQAFRCGDGYLLCAPRSRNSKNFNLRFDSSRALYQSNVIILLKPTVSLRLSSSHGSGVTATPAIWGSIPHLQIRYVVLGWLLLFISWRGNSSVCF